MRGKREISRISRQERKAEDLCASHGFIEAEHENEHTLDATQEYILEQVNLGTRSKKWRHIWERRGPFKVDYTQDGSVMLAAGLRGEARLLDCMKSGEEICKVQPNEDIRAARMCYNEQCWALAQRSSVCLYDRGGTRIHDFTTSDNTTAIDYLPYHFLLVTASGFNHSRPIEWRDLSTGKFAAQLKTKKLSLGPESLRHSSFNAMTYTGHTDGVVRIWSPALDGEAMSFFASSGGVDTVCPFGPSYVAVSGPSGTVSIYDIRNASEALNYYRLKSAGPVSMDVSYTGLLAISQGPQVIVWKNPTGGARLGDTGTDGFKPRTQAELLESHKDKLYMRHRYGGNGLRFENIRFRPFEDVLGGGLNKGVETHFIIGSGSAAIDVLENNPYATTREKAKALVRRLLDKLPADTIVLDPRNLASVKISETAEPVRKRKRSKKEHESSRIRDLEKNPELLRAPVAIT